MKTPICDFVKEYMEKKSVRAHMPGHKGKSFLGFEALDITEISGADSLYEADGIIKESESCASRLFGCSTYYSAEGSSLCIRAMVYLIAQYARENGKDPLILAGRNAHKTFLSALCLTDTQVEWLYSDGNYLSCNITPESLSKKLSSTEKKPAAVYITSPDYLGNISDIKALGEVCKKYGVLLCVDNAHGAYLKFLPESYHPCDLGADMCCSSAHKTLPVITGGAYLHIGGDSKDFFCERAKDAMALFASTSPSYLILQSLDAANSYISHGYKEKLEITCKEVDKIKKELSAHGFSIYGKEPLKLCIQPKSFGYTGTQLAKLLFEKGIECEFSDPDNTVLMFTSENEKSELFAIKEALLSVKKLPEIKEKAPIPFLPERRMSVRQAMFSKSKIVPTKNAVGSVLASPSVSCPPAVPIVVCGEVIDKNALEAFSYYGIDSLRICDETAE